MLLSLLALQPACALEHLEAALAEHEDTYDTTNPAGSDTTAPDTTARDSTTTDTTTSSAGSGSDTTGEPGTTASTDTTTTADPGTTTTTGPPPVCGDGLQDPGEECDDGNADPMDGCKDCARDRFIFVTSVEYQGGEIDGLYGADQRCRTQAALAKLPNFATYRAWLSDSKLAAADRLLHHPGRYTLVNGLVVAMDWADLTDGTLENPITVTEFSESPDSVPVWTGTLHNGKSAFGSSFCFDWTDTNSNWDLELGGSGIRTQTDALWSYLAQDGCGSTAALYCLEQ
jgi:cysteine-rich repeat protein